LTWYFLAKASQGEFLYRSDEVRRVMGGRIVQCSFQCLVRISHLWLSREEDGFVGSCDRKLVLAGHPYDFRAPAMTNTTPPASATTPTIGGGGLLFSLSTEALSGPRSMIFSRVVYVKPW